MQLLSGFVSKYALARKKNAIYSGFQRVSSAQKIDYRTKKFYN
jgi:hypothetical protein